MRKIFFDFEYRDNYRREDLVLFAYRVGDVRGTFDLRGGLELPALRKFAKEYANDIWCAFNAKVDLTALLAAGVDITDFKVIDLMAEANMVTLTHPALESRKFALVNQRKMFKIPSEFDSVEKDIAREIILAHKTYTASQWDLIVRYGLSDVETLPELYKRVRYVHRCSGVPYKLQHALERGEYIKCATIFDFIGGGFPVDEDYLNEVFGKKDAVRDEIIRGLNAKYGDLYRWNNRSKTWTLKLQAYDDLIDRLGYPWERSDSGKHYSRKGKLIEEKSKTYPFLIQLNEGFKTLQSLNSTDLRSLEKDGYIRGGYTTFCQRTSRTSPLPSKGFLLNLTPWMRNAFVRPHKGEVLIGIDWSQQEVAIAAALSNDIQLLKVYNSGDAYLALGKLAGIIPPDGTKKTHRLERENFKAVQLGLGYGKGLNALVENVYANYMDESGKPTKSREECAAIAEHIFDWHKDTFDTYWDWIAEQISDGEGRGWTKSIDNWFYYVSSQTPRTRLLNFPMQSCGAALMRRATINLFNLTEVQLVCTLHDALYVIAKEGEEEQVAKEVHKCMDKAVKDLLGDVVKIRVDINFYRHETGYTDPRGTVMSQKIKRLIAAIATQDQEVTD